MTSNLVIAGEYIFLTMHATESNAMIVLITLELKVITLDVLTDRGLI